MATNYAQQHRDAAQMRLADARYYLQTGLAADGESMYGILARFAFEESKAWDELAELEAVQEGRQ